MPEDTHKPANNWRHTVSAFRIYLQQSVELIAYKPEITTVDAPLSPNPRKDRFRKQTQVIPDVKHSNPVPPLSEDEGWAAFKLSRRRYSSPLWVGLGDEDG